MAMSEQTAHSVDDPQQLLSSSNALVAQVRQKQRATWLPLFVFSCATFLAIPVLHFGYRTLTNCGAPASGGNLCRFYPSWGVWYWPVTLVLSYIAISFFYIRRAHAQGLETRIRTFVWVGVGIAIAVTLLGYWAVHLPVRDVNLFGMHFQERSLGWLHRMVTPAFAIGLSLMVLARIERNKALACVSALFLSIVLVPIDFGWNLNSSLKWNFLPRLIIQGSYLFLAACGFLWIQKPWQGRTR